MEYKSEEEFLKHYDPNQFERLSLTTDILLFSVADGVQENYRKLNKKYFSVLLIKRDTYPFKGKWCLPGGFIRMDETTDEASKRILKDETNLEDIYLEQLYTFSAVDRDPRMRVISTAYMSLVDKNRLHHHLVQNASWFHIHTLEDEDTIKVFLENGEEQLTFEVRKHLKEITTAHYEYEIVNNECLAFDHALTIVMGMERLKNKIEYTDIVFHMMPRYFTLGELQQVYEIILGKKLLDPAFRRMISNKVRKTDKMKTGGGHRPSALFEYIHQSK